MDDWFGHTKEDWERLPWGYHRAYAGADGERGLAEVRVAATRWLHAVDFHQTPPSSVNFVTLGAAPKLPPPSAVVNDDSERRCVCGLYLVYPEYPAIVATHTAGEEHRRAMIERGLWRLEEHPPSGVDAFMTRAGMVAPPPVPEATPPEATPPEATPPEAHPVVAMPEARPDPITLPPLEVYTDGSGTFENRVCGAGVTILDGEVIVGELARHLGLGTNNRAELSGVGAALRLIGDSPWRGRRLVFRPDSDYTIHMLTKERDPYPDQPNANLIHVIRRMLPARDRVSFVHVKGHSGVPGNERSDQLASWARKLYLDAPDASTETAATGASIVDLGTEVVATVARHGGEKPLAELAAARLAVRMLDAPHWRKRAVVLCSDSDFALDALRARRDPDNKFQEALARFFFRGRLEKMPPEE